MIPYTYRIYHSPTGKSYYGAQWGKTSDPANLWRTYFTSSGLVLDLIKHYGKESFKVRVTRIFDTHRKNV